MTSKKTKKMDQEKNIIDDVHQEVKPQLTLCSPHEIVIKAMPEGSTHKFKKVCAKCNIFLGWHSNIAKIETLEGRKKIIEIIAPHATIWEKNFFKSMLKIDKLSEKQLLTWKNILNDYVTVDILKKTDIEDEITLLKI